MNKAVYILSFFLGIQFFAVGQELSVDELLGNAIDLVDEKPEESIEITEKAFKKARRAGDHYGMVSAKNIMGYIGMATGDYEASYINYSDALEYLDKSDTVDLYNKVSILNSLAIIKSIYGDHDGSSKLYELAYQTALLYVDQYRDFAEEAGDLRLLVDLPYEMSIQLKKNGEYLRAGEILVDLWEKSEFRGDSIMLAQVVNQLGLIKKENKEFNKAQEFFAIAAFGDGVEATVKAMALHNLASTYMEQKDYSKAEKYFDEALELKLNHADGYAQFITMLDQGELLYINGNANKAIDKWESALEIYDGVNDYPDLFVVYDWLQKAYLKQDITKSELYGNLYSANIKDWMSIQSSQKEGVPTLQAFNTRIDAILSDRALKAERLALLKRYWPLGVVALLIIMLFVYLVQVSLNKKREQMLERNLKVDRASVADEILNRIRRD